MVGQGQVQGTTESGFRVNESRQPRVMGKASHMLPDRRVGRTLTYGGGSIPPTATHPLSQARTKGHQRFFISATRPAIFFPGTAYVATQRTAQYSLRQRSLPCQ